MKQPQSCSVAASPSRGRSHVGAERQRQITEAGTYSVAWPVLLAPQKPPEQPLVLIRYGFPGITLCGSLDGSIAKLAKIAVAARVDNDRKDALAEVTRATGGEEPLTIEMPRIDISSTLIRERAYAGNTVAHLVPAGVSEIIEEQGLYT